MQPCFQSRDWHQSPRFSSCIHLCNNYFLNAWHVPAIIVGTGDWAVNETDEKSLPCAGHISVPYNTLWVILVIRIGSVRMGYQRNEAGCLGNASFSKFCSLGKSATLGYQYNSPSETSSDSLHRRVKGGGRLWAWLLLNIHFLLEPCPFHFPVSVLFP